MFCQFNQPVIGASMKTQFGALVRVKLPELAESDSIEMNWYYFDNDQQVGPLSEEELHQLKSSGALQDDALVWQEGMSDWQSYCSVFGSEPTQFPPEIEPDLGAASAETEAASMASAAGTGGRTSNTELRANARKALAGQWAPAIGVVLVWFVLQQVGGFIPILGIFIAIIITGPLMLGLHEYFLRVHRAAGPDFSHLFGGFSNYGLGLGIYIVMLLIMLGAMIISAIPGGIVMGIGIAQSGGGSPEDNPVFWIGIGLMVVSYVIIGMFLYLLFSMAYFIGVDEPENGAIHAIKKSPSLLMGNKGKLFMMFLVFVGWSLLTVFTFFIGMLWVLPYFYTSLAAFYDDIHSGEKEISPLPA